MPSIWLRCLDFVIFNVMEERLVYVCPQPLIVVFPFIGSWLKNAVPKFRGGRGGAEVDTATAELVLMMVP